MRLAAHLAEACPSTPSPQPVVGLRRANTHLVEALPPAGQVAELHALQAPRQLSIQRAVHAGGRLTPGLCAVVRPAVACT